MPGGERAEDRPLIPLQVAEKHEGTAVEVQALVVQVMRVEASQPAVQQGGGKGKVLAADTGDRALDVLGPGLEVRW